MPDHGERDPDGRPHDTVEGTDEGRVDHPIEEWTDQELMDQLVYVRAEFADMEVGPDDTTSPVAEIKAEIARRGIEVPDGSDLATPGREDRDQGGDLRG